MNEREFADLKTKAAETTFQIGRCYETGDGVGKDEAEAVKWYRMAAKQGSAQSMIELGKCYTFGIGVRKNRAMVFKCLRQAAEHGHVKAMILLGKRYLSEYNAEYAPREGIKWLRRAADRGDAWAMFELGECYENGIGVKKDSDAAYLCFCRAALAAPEDELLYQMVQNRIFEPKLKEVLGK